MRYSPEFFVTYSKDREAVQALAYWQERRRELPFWKRRERDEADGAAARARQRCIDAGIDWSQVDTPPAGFAAPERSSRLRIGTVHAEAIDPRSADDADQGAPVRNTREQGATSAAAGVAGGLAGAAAWQWLTSRPAPLHQNADGSAFFQSTDGGYWFADSAGQLFGLAETGSWLALDSDGFLWGLSDAGQYVTWATDGSVVSLANDGNLYSFASDGSLLALGDDGSFYMQGVDGAFYTSDADDNFYGVDEYGNYFEAPDGSGFSAADFAALDGAADASDGGEGDGFLDWLS
jgi:hypothetical protein